MMCHFAIVRFSLVWAILQIVPPCAATAETLASAGAGAEATGTVTGVVTERWAKLAAFPTLVYIATIDGKTFEPSREAAVIDQRERKFIPRVMPILAGGAVAFHNNDDTTHNVYSIAGAYDLGDIAPGEVVVRTFPDHGAYEQLCHVHPRMKGYVIVLQNPYYSFTDRDGSYTIHHVPQGSWRLRVWNERMWTLDRWKTFAVTVNAGQTSTVQLSFR